MGQRKWRRRYWRDSGTRWQLWWGRRQFHPDEKKADKKPPKNAWEEKKDFKENDHAERALLLPERLKFDKAEKEEKPKHTRSAEDERLNEREFRC